MWGCYLGFFAGGQRFQQRPNLMEYIPRVRCLKRKTKHSLGSKLGTLLRILRYQLHQPAGIDTGLTGKSDVDLITLAIHLGHSRPLALLSATAR